MARNVRLPSAAAAAAAQTTRSMLLSQLRLEECCACHCCSDRLQLHLLTACQVKRTVAQDLAMLVMFVLVA
jgi:hypothetical protein